MRMFAIAAKRKPHGAKLLKVELSGPTKNVKRMTTPMKKKAMMLTYICGYIGSKCSFSNIAITYMISTTKSTIIKIERKIIPHFRLKQ